MTCERRPTRQENGWLYHADLPLSAALSFSDLPREAAIAHIGSFAKHSAASLATPLTYAGYRDVPVSYLVCEEDRLIPARAQRAGIGMVERESGNGVEVASLAGAGHVPMASRPQEVIDWIVHVAELAQAAAGK